MVASNKFGKGRVAEINTTLFFLLSPWPFVILSSRPKLPSTDDGNLKERNMRSSAVLYGIKGIFPLIKKHAPDCITPLTTLDALPRSTRLAIDATLLIQRLHFADDSHPSRHLLGFHRLIRQLRESSLVPIMVFDNFSQGARLPAKMRENEKRKAKRNLLIVRADMERLRGKRLEALAKVLKEWTDLQERDRIKTSELLQIWNQEEKSRQVQDIDDVPLDFEAFDDAFDLDFGRLEEVNKTLYQADSLQDIPYISEDRDEFLVDALAPEDLFKETLLDKPSLPKSNDLWAKVQEAESSTILYMASKIHRLRRQYGARLSADKADTQASSNIGMHMMPSETPTQAQMTKAEGSVYSLLQAGRVETGQDLDSLVGTSQAEAAFMDIEQDAVEIDEVKAEEEHQEQLLALTAKNVSMQRSYSRSSTPLSKNIFEACATLCHLLKVPVLWTGDGSRSGGRRHEAEALASMLVRNKLADVVVSEDSDVLLYGVPLLRGVMGHKGLEYVDSVKVRKSLFPPPPNVPEEEAEKFSQKQMLDFSLLCGTDFNRTVPGIGSITALKLIREYKSIQGIRLEALQRRIANQVERKRGEKEKVKKSTREVTFSLPDNLKWRDYSKELNEARRVFENPPSLYWEAHKLRNHSKEEQIDYDALNQFLRQHGIASKESSMTLPLETRSNNSTLHSHAFSSGFGSSPFSDGRGPVASWTV